MLNLQHRNQPAEKMRLYQFFANKYIAFFEQRMFGICSWLGSRLGIRASTIRLYFVYLSFFTFGSPVIIYLVLAFIREHKASLLLRNLRPHKRIWDL